MAPFLGWPAVFFWLPCIDWQSSCTLILVTSLPSFTTLAVFQQLCFASEVVWAPDAHLTLYKKEELRA